MGRRRAKPEQSRAKAEMRPELAAAIAGFRPVFGNEQDRAIAERIGALLAALAKGSRDTAFLERSLLEDVTARNMDF